MAEKRMFSKKVVSGGRFNRMPATARLLYFALGMDADDDGVVEAYDVLNATGTREDDLRVLVSKGYLTCLDSEDLVFYINHWSINNSLRADRKKDSIHKDLLLRTVTGINYQEAKQRADRPAKPDSDPDGVGRPMDSTGTAQGQHSIGEYRLVEDRIDKKDPLSSSGAREQKNEEIPQGSAQDFAQPDKPDEAEDVIIYADENVDEIVDLLSILGVDMYRHQIHAEAVAFFCYYAQRGWVLDDGKQVKDWKKLFLSWICKVKKLGAVSMKGDGTA